MSLKKSLKKSIAAFMAASIISSNCYLCGIGISEVIAEEVKKPNVAISLENSKYVQYQNEEYSGVAIQTSLKVNTNLEQENYLPTDSAEILLNLPELNGYYPERASVVVGNTYLTTGEKNNEKINQNYDSNSGLLSVSYENKDEYSKFVQGINDEFEIIYIYPAQAYVGNEEKIDLKYKANVTMKFVDGEESITTQKTENITLQEKENKGNLLTFAVTELKDKIYKGFMYSNVENETSYKTDYKTVSTLCVLNSAVNNELILEAEESKFIIDNEEENEISSNGHVQYIATGIDKTEFDKILGKDGYMEFYQDEEVIATVKYVEIEKEIKLAVIYLDGQVNILEDEDKNLIVEYPENLGNIRIKLSPAIAEGFINFENQKTINGADDYGYKLDKIQAIKEILTVNGYTSNTNLLLLEPETKISITSSNANFSTLQKNKTTITVNLDDTNASTKLFSNPVITVKLPEGLITGNLSSPEIVNGNGLTIKDATAKENVITIELEGKQKEYDITNVSGGTSIVMDIENMDFEDTIPTHTDKIEVTCKQGNEIVESNCEINMVSKSGLLVLSNLSGFDDNNTVLTTIDSGIKNVEIESGAEEKEVIQSLNLVNNYEKGLENLQIVGRIGYSSEEIVSTFDIELLKPVEVNGKVYYSTNLNASYNDDSWQEEFTTDAKAYKIEFNNETLDSKDTAEIKVYIKVPANVEYNQKVYTKTDVDYIYNEKNVSDSSTIGMLTPVKRIEDSKENNAISENVSILREEEAVEEISMNTQIQTGDIVIDNTSEVLEGQILKYKVNITNNSNEDKNNLKLKTTIANAVYYELVETNEGYNLFGTTLHKYAEAAKNDLIREVEISIPANTTKEYEYQVVVNEDVEDISNTVQLTTFAGEAITSNLIENKVKSSKLRLKVEYSYNEEREVYSNDTMNISLFVKNLSGGELKNVPVTIKLPEELECYSYEFYATANLEMDYDEETNTITTIISSIPKDVEYKIIILNKTKSIDKNLEYKTVTVVASSTFDNVKYMSNELTKDIKQIGSDLKLNLSDDFNNKEVKDGDVINYTLQISNSGLLDYEAAKIYANFANGVELVNAQLIYSDGKVENIDVSNNIIDKELTISKNDNITIKCQVEINASGFEVKAEELENRFSLSNGLGLILEKTSTLTIDENSINNGKQEETPNEGEDVEKPSDTPVEDEGNTGTEDNEQEQPSQDNKTEENPGVETYTISGVAWIDVNKNGQKDTDEKLQDSVVVSLVDMSKGNFALDTNGNRITTVTDSEGRYIFSNIQKGTYIVLFEFDTNTYTVTTYQKEEIENDVNSDVILSNVTIDGNKKVAALTDRIELNSNKENIDIGLMENVTFDLSLNKQITKITVITPNGTESYEYEDGETAKVDLVAKYMNDTNVIVNYKFTIANEGDITGYVNSLVDNLPTGLEFSSELNNDWYKGSDGNLYTTSLSGKAIAPGETAEVELVLTKNMTEENAGIFPNSAELEKISNLQNIQEKEEDLENNQSSATLIISIKTGSAIMYIGITTLCLAIMGIGIYFIKKKVLVRGI